MARKTTTVKIDNPDSRDHGKEFIITELPSTQGEKWAARALNALLASGVDIPDNIAKMGLRGVAVAAQTGRFKMDLSSFNGIPWSMAEPLLDEMMTCVQIIPDPARPAVIRPLIESDIEEIGTRLKLRMEWLGLHLGFSLAAKIPTSDSAAE